MVAVDILAPLAGNSRGLEHRGQDAEPPFHEISSKLAASCAKSGPSPRRLKVIVADLGSRHRRAPDLQSGCTTASGERLFAIMSTGHEAELHSPAGRARRRGGVPERRPAPQFPPGGGGARRDAVGDQPGDTRARGARRRGALHPHDPQRRPDRSRRALPRRAPSPPSRSWSPQARSRAISGSGRPGCCASRCRARSCRSCWSR